jgi:hypothetical protein
MSLLEHYLSLKQLEFETLSENQIKELDRDLPSQALKPHPTKSYLTTINAAFLYDILNDVFGVGGWVIDSSVIKGGSKQNDKNGEQMVAKVELLIPKYGIYRMSYGGNDNIDIGDAYKGAVTDAVTKICSTLMKGVNKVWKNEAGKSSSNVTTEKQLSWLSFGSEEYNKILERIKNKEITNIGQVEALYKIASSVKNQLLTVLN